MTTAPTILVLFAHLAIGRSRINQAMLAAVRGLDGVTVHDLLESYPDFYIDVDRERQLLRDADVLVVQHPVYWYGVPAIIKHWFDSVLTRGFAYGPGGDALHGKKLFQACSTGAPASAYATDGPHGAPFTSFLVPMRQAARFCGMEYLPPHVLHGGHGLPEEVIAEHALRYRERLKELAGGSDTPARED